MTNIYTLRLKYQRDTFATPFLHHRPCICPEIAKHRHSRLSCIEHARPEAETGPPGNIERKRNVNDLDTIPILVTIVEETPTKKTMCPCLPVSPKTMWSDVFTKRTSKHRLDNPTEGARRRVREGKGKRLQLEKTMKPCTFLGVVKEGKTKMARILHTG